MNKDKRPVTVHFGFDPTRSQNHFAVVPVGTTRVRFVERYGDNDDSITRKEVIKAELDVERWRRIKDEAADVFNNYLRSAGNRSSFWRKRAPTLLERHLGRELMLLVWASEGQDLSVLPAVLLNWRGFAPEERWWLYSTINASRRHPQHADRGWRKAIKIALAENPVDTSAFLSETQLARRSGIGEGRP